MTKIIISGFPRHRSSYILDKIATEFKLDRPSNIWGETHKFAENKVEWLNNDNAIFKLWPIHDNNFIDILKDYNGNIIFTYSEDIALFSAKLFRSHVTRDWGITKRNTGKVSYFEHAEELSNIIPKLQIFCNSITNAMSSKSILLKSAFVNEDKMSCHIQSTLNPSIALYLKSIIKEYSKPSIDDYILEGKEEFYEQIYKNIGSRL